MKSVSENYEVIKGSSLERQVSIVFRHAENRGRRLQAVDIYSAQIQRPDVLRIHNVPPRFSSPRRDGGAIDRERAPRIDKSKKREQPKRESTAAGPFP